MDKKNEMKIYYLRYHVLMLLTGFLIPACGQDNETRYITENGYENCIEISNSICRVVIDPNVGGRVLKYELHGKNILHEDPSMDGKMYVPGEEFGRLSAGRIDIGPQQVSPKRPLLFFGKWDGKITGERTAELVSQADTVTGVQLVRYFALDEKTSRFRITQVIRNITNDTVRYCYWGRSFAKGGGISLTPLNPHSRYPRGSIVHGPGSVMDYQPAPEKNVRIREGILEIIGPPERPKFGMDSYPGWLAYISRDDLLFVKKFPIFQNRVYGEMAGYTTSIWYNGLDQVEIEPFGPLENIPPGEEASFSVEWYLETYPYPPDRKANLDEIRKIIINL